MLSFTKPDLKVRQCHSASLLVNTLPAATPLESVVYYCLSSGGAATCPPLRTNWIVTKIDPLYHQYNSLRVYCLLSFLRSNLRARQPIERWFSRPF